MSCPENETLIYGYLDGKLDLLSALTREAERDAENLLAVRPDATDAYVTLGAANYIIGSLPRA